MANCLTPLKVGKWVKVIIVELFDSTLQLNPSVLPPTHLHPLHYCSNATVCPIGKISQVLCESQHVVITIISFSDSDTF